MRLLVLLICLAFAFPAAALTPQQPPAQNDIITLLDTAKATVPLKFQNLSTGVTTAPIGGAVSVDNANVASAALSPDGSTLTVTGLVAGTTTVVYSVNGVVVTRFPVVVKSSQVVIPDVASGIVSPK